uniref:Retrovirus-related Pol polyprotein from transposon opus n=1 Tax=Schistocephalus solidus TaxID=70667 RepID=A0A0X3NR42_SCHSO
MVHFYRRFLPNCADTIPPVTNLLSGPKRSFELTQDALVAFKKGKPALTDATLLTHSTPDTPIALNIDASNVAVGAVLQQHLVGQTQTLAFFSRKLTPTELHYSTFGRELLVVYLAVKHSQHFLEGRDFTIFTDHKPLSFAFKSNSDKINGRELRQLDFISQFNSVLPRPSVSESYSEKDLATCSLDYPRCDRVCRPLEPPPPMTVHSGLSLEGQRLSASNATFARRF